MLIEQTAEKFKVIVIGAGQAGLSVGYHLKNHGIPFVILDANKRVGDSWRNRWDSLRLFTPAKYDSLDGMPFPAPAHYFPTKDEMADYLENYASHFKLPVRSGIKVDSLSREGNFFCIKAGENHFQAEHCVVAMSNYQVPKIPKFSGQLNPDITQLHSSEYKHPSQLNEGDVLIVGAGNSGAELSMEMIKDNRRVLLSGRDTGHLPFDIESAAARIVFIRLVLRFLFYKVLTTSTPIGKKVRPKLVSMGGPLIRQKPKGLKKAGIKRVPRVAGVKDGFPLLEDGSVVKVNNVIWCTGFYPAFSWIDIPAFKDREPMQNRGIVEKEKGLYFVGLHFLYALASAMVHGVGRDAEHVAKCINESINAYSN